MSVESQGPLPPWVINLILWVSTVLSLGFTGVLTWVFRKYTTKVDVLEQNQKYFATVKSVAEMQLKLAPMISRSELLAYLKQMREDQEKQNERIREDRLRMHQENRGDIGSLRDDVRAVHARIDELFTK